MFREMRRSDRMMQDAEAKEFLKNGFYGVLSVQGDDGYPYGVPINYAYRDGALYLHGFLGGHKMDGIQRDPKVCFTVFGETVNLPDQVSTNYTSVIVFGKAEILPLGEEVKDQGPAAVAAAEAARDAAFEAIGFKYCGENDHVRKYIAAEKSTSHIIKINVEHLTGKRRNL